jgi:hypothetical protein
VYTQHTIVPGHLYITPAELAVAIFRSELDEHEKAETSTLKQVTLKHPPETLKRRKIFPGTFATNATVDLGWIMAFRNTETIASGSTKLTRRK